MSVRARRRSYPCRLQWRRRCGVRCALMTGWLCPIPSTELVGPGSGTGSELNSVPQVPKKGRATSERQHRWGAVRHYRYVEDSGSMPFKYKVAVVAVVALFVDLLD